MKYNPCMIRTMGHGGYRRGEWALLVGVAWFEPNGRPVFQVMFPDGMRDSWVINDLAGEYEFQNGPSPDYIESIGTSIYEQS